MSLALLRLVAVIEILPHLLHALRSTGWGNVQATGSFIQMSLAPGTGPGRNWALGDRRR